MQEFGKAGKDGCIVKGSNYLDILTKTKAIIFDKTGTITKGNFEVNKIILSSKITEEELLEKAAKAEYMSNHPIAKSIVRKFNKEIKDKEIKDFKEIAGKGIKARIAENEIVIGNEKLLEEEKIKYYTCNESGTVVYVAENKKYLGAIIIKDEIKEDSKLAIEELRKNGINKIYMLTGDNNKTAKEVGKEVGINEVYSNLLPQEKLTKLDEIRNQKNVVIAIGDGINDSPLLANADIGISIGNTGSDLAIETSDVVIIDGKLSNVNKLIKSAKRTKRIVMQNIYFVIGVKIIVLILGAFGISNMWEAVFADVGVTFITVLNDLRILR